MPRYFKESEINSLFDVSCKESFAICKIYLFCYHFNYSKKSWPTRIYAVALKKKTFTGSESVLPSAGCTGRGSWRYFAGKNQGTSCQRDTRTSKKHLPWNFGIACHIQKKPRHIVTRSERSIGA